MFHNRKLSAWKPDQWLERAKELGVCIIAPFAMLLFLFIIKIIKINGFNANLEPKDKIDTNAIQNIHEAFRYGNYWVWQTFPESYTIEQDRKAMIKECYNSLNKMSIIASGRPLVNKKEQNL